MTIDDLVTWRREEERLALLDANVALAIGQALTKADAARPDLLSRAGYDQELRAATKRLLDVAKPVEDLALERVLRALDRDWRRGDAAQRGRWAREATSAIGEAGAAVGARVVPALRDLARRVVLAGFDGAVARYELGNLEIEQRSARPVADAAARAQATFVELEHDRRAEAIAGAAAVLVEEGLDAGADRDTITEILREEVVQASDGRWGAYLIALGAALITKMRSFGMLLAFQAAEIDSYIWVSVLDAITSDICRFMHGTVFRVRSGVRRFETVAAAPALAVKELQPFIARGRDEEGGLFLFYRRGKERVRLATVERSGIGSAGDRGEYSNAITEAELEMQGFCAPPAHHHCRSILAPHGRR